MRHLIAIIIAVCPCHFSVIINLLVVVGDSVVVVGVVMVVMVVTVVVVDVLVIAIIWVGVVVEAV